MSLVHVYLSTNRYDFTLVNDEDPPVPQDSAVVTTTIRNGPTASSPVVAGITWPVTVTGLGGGTGVYRYTPPLGALLAGKTYYVVTDANLAGVTAHSEVVVICQRDST